MPHFSDVLKKDPKDATAYLGRAAAELALGQHDKVIADCDQVLKLDPNSVAAFHLRPAPGSPKTNPKKRSRIWVKSCGSNPIGPKPIRLRGDLWRK